MSNIKTGDILNFDYTGAVQTVTLPKGTYKLECWGAQGGNGANSASGFDSSSGAIGGKGGYSTGVISLNTSTVLYVYVGGKGGCITTDANDYTGGFNGGGKGGVSGSMSRSGGGGGASDIRIGQDSLYARVIVAGGGGATSWGSSTESGDAGGGLSSIAGSSSPGLSTQISGNTFGIGSDAQFNSGYNINGAGGGGWYGGISSSQNMSGGTKLHGGGGSGYVYTSSTAVNYPSGCLLNSSYYLTDAQTIAGNQTFLSPNKVNETGHSNNGYVRITVIECNSGAGLYSKINNSMKKAVGFYFKLNNQMYGITNASTVNGDVMIFDYTGSVQTATLNPGTYKLECWGAQGGTYSSNIGGRGGYSVGTLTLTEKTLIYVYVGERPTSGTNAGFNGGGAGVISGKGGGGATDIRLKKDSLYARVIVAGGGGGAGVGTASTNPCGCGGGEYGGDGYYNNTTGSYLIGNNRSGGSASQTAGGKTWNTGAQAAFGVGGDASGYSCGGGGGGWYGGGGAYDNDSDSDGHWGGGGSGYVYTSSTSSNYPVGCLLNSSYYLTDAQTIAGNTSFISPDGSAETGHSGNGFARITNLSPNNIIYINQNSIMNFNYTGSVQSITLNAGSYKLECWGAQGGYRSDSAKGGAGGYSTGVLTLTDTTTLYIYVGGSGNSVTTSINSIYFGGFNGGGYRRGYNGGGGASDIRIGTISLYSRVIVAGGGGSDGSQSYAGGYAGGESGARGSFGCGSYGYGGGQTSSYTAISAIAAQGTTNSSSNCAAGFGFGGFGCYTSSGYGGAGGGGWYGGQGTYPDGSYDDDGGGGGGSGYVYTSSTASNYPSGCLLNSSYYLTNAQTIAGNQTFLSPNGGNETGHTGNGHVRITNFNPKQCGLFIKQNDTWTHIVL